ncbi:MAG: DUF2029 domain-containing protein, partial [Planctomycetota bacterium]
GAVLLIGLWPLRRTALTPRGWLWLVSVGAVMRVLVAISPPLLENDYYRYLWDGAILAHGHNPYAHAPEDALRALESGSTPHWLPEPATSQRGRDVLARVNHPRLTTVYGPFAQAAFAAAHLIAPWSIYAWRAVLLMFDAATFVLLVMLLRRLAAPLVWSAWYWWNPVLLREVIGSGHMDVLAFPLVLAALWLAVRRAPLRASLVLALAAAVKIWPIILAPLVLRAGAPRLRSALLTGATLLATSALLWLPVLSAPNDESNGFLAFAGSWYNNDALYRSLVFAGRWLLPLFGVHPGHASFASRVFLSTALMLLIAWQTLRLVPRADDTIRRALFIVAAAFLLNPAQFPWYYLWMLPLLALRPRPSLLGYTALLPLYYVHYEHVWVVWLEHVPVAVLLILEWRIDRRTRARARLRTSSLAGRRALECE